MKNLKMFQAALVITVISFFAGCSDQITSSGEQSNIGNIAESDQNLEKGLFKTRITLKPNSDFTFNFANTGLISLNSIEIVPVYASESGSVPEACKDILVYSHQTGQYELSCHSYNFNLKELSIKNTGSSLIKADVIVWGKKRVKRVTEQE